MMPNKPMLFFDTDCGCGSSPCGETPPAICDPAYFSLAQGSKMRLIGVTLGSQCQTFLAPDVAGKRGFVFMDNDGQVFVENEPKLRLPDWNPAVSGSFPEPAGFGALMMADGPNPEKWYFLRPVTGAELTLVCKMGQWMLVDTAGLAGQTAVCNNPSNVQKTHLFGCYDTGTTDGDGNPIYALRKLAPGHRRAVVGDIDPGTGLAGFTCLQVGEELFQDFMKTTLHRAAAYKQYNLTGGADDTGGIATGVVTGVGAVTDYEFVMYSPSTNRFARPPAAVAETLTVDVDVPVADNGTFVDMGGHAKFLARTFNYTKFEFTASVRLRAAGGTPSYNNIFFGLYVDNVLVNTWDLKNDTSVALSYIGTIAKGPHDIDLRFKQTADADSTMTVKFSTSTLKALLQQ